MSASGRLRRTATERLGVTARAARWIRRSIANRIVILGAALAASFVVVTGALAFLVTRAVVVDGVRASLTSEATLVAQRFEGYLLAVQSDVAGLARSPLVANGLVDSAGRASYLQPFLRDHRLPAPLDVTPYRLGLADHTGKVIASSAELTGRFGGRPWWSALVERGVEHAGMLDEGEHGEPTLVLAYPVVYPATRLPEGALVLELPISAVFGRAARMLPAGHVAALRVTSGDRLNEIVAPGPPRPGDPLEVAVALGTAGLALPLDMTVSVQTERATALAPLSRLALMYAIGGAVVLVLAGAASWISARRLLAPLRRLSLAADAVQRGRSDDVRFETVGEDEPAQLARTLQHMVDGLRAAQGSLEARVAERTLELEFAESRLREIVDHMLDGLVTIDEHGRIESFSHGAERIFGWRAAEVLGRSVSCLMPEPDRSHHDGYVRRYLETGERKVIGSGREVEGLRRSGDPFPMELSVSEVRLRGRPVFVGLVRDLTERRKIERMKSEFVSVVSHELRTPLTAVRGALGLLRGGVVGALDEKQRQLVTIADENGERLSRLINDLLDVQKIESGAMQFRFEPAPVPELLREAVALNQAFAQRLQVEIATVGALPPIVVSVDRHRFQQIMSNLLSNACKYSPPGGRVEVRAVDVGAGTVRIEVRDRGPGIPEAFREHIFERFSQSDASSTRAREGTGLGLSIARSLVERMRGRIDYVSAAGEGTTFFVELPAEPAAVRAATAEAT
ncbi:MULTISPECIES: sensor histidine kinase [Anaeromyxobacter]|uniref:sensor histidine kinase n=1 Tax=Anaeromyxobacter TaxID=161492 RepID=UPI001F563458|nr:MULTISPECIES: ATP-binding protein [unclassified Anaeromyxobacter]